MIVRCEKQAVHFIPDHIGNTARWLATTGSPAAKHSSSESGMLSAFGLIR